MNRGRGLGLAAVSGIVRRHHGAFWVTSTRAGTTFRIAFPLAAPVAPIARPPAAAPWVGVGTVLVIDDDAVVRRTTARMVEALGFSVLAAPSGEDGLARYREAPGRITAVLLDLTMPGLDGVATLQALRQVDPTVRVLVMTGYSEAEVSRRFAGGAPSGFLEKPFHLADLRNRLRAVIEAA